MQALTTENVREHITPGSTVRDARGDVHSVFKVLNSGYGFAGVLLTTRMIGNGLAVNYGVWTVTPEGTVSATMATTDFPAASGAFEARVIKMIRAEFQVLEGDAG